jgi:hypothetical protein
MKIASYNLENLFDRARILNQDSWASAKPVLDDFAALNAVLRKPKYTAADKTRIVALLTALDLGSGLITSS